MLGREHRVERSVGMRPRTLLGMGIGLLGGAVGGGILATAMYEPPNCANRVSFLSSCNVDGGASNTLADAVVGSEPGRVIGGLVGARNKNEAWRPMAERGVRVAIAPTAKGGAQLTARMSF